MKKTLLVLASAALAYASNAQATRTVLMEEYTGTWCVNCPDGHNIIKSISTTYPNTFLNIGMHNGDAYTIPYETAMEAIVQVGGFPRATVDRFTYPQGNFFCMSRSNGAWVNAVAARVNVTAPVEFTKLNATMNPSTRVLTVETDYKFLSSINYDTRITCLVLEDSIIANQTGGGVNYVHMDVCRATLSADTWGDVVQPTTVNAGDVFSKTYTYTVPAGLKEKNLRVVAFINKKVGASPVLSTGTEILNAKGTAVVTSFPLSNTEISIPTFSVGSVYPNPTTDLCALDFYLPTSAKVAAVVTDMRGTIVANLCDGPRSAGKHTIMWSNYTTDGSAKMPSGTYVMQLSIDGKLYSKKVILQ
jgi:hypothetical protein